MPESVSGVDAILDGLRERKVETPYGYAVVFAAVEEAVHAAADARTAEIVALLTEQAQAIPLGDRSEDSYNVAIRQAREVARRFPNEGTTDGPE